MGDSEISLADSTGLRTAGRKPAGNVGQSNCAISTVRPARAKPRRMRRALVFSPLHRHRDFNAAIFRTTRGKDDLTVDLIIFVWNSLEL